MSRSASDDCFSQTRIRLRTLGSIDLRDGQGRSIDALVTQPKRLALFVYLAVSTRGDFRRRDTLLGLLWPERSLERARNALNKAVYLLRQGLGKEVIISRGSEEIGLDSTRLWCDVVAFEQAFEEGALDDAANLYHGAFMEGFHLPNAPEFEIWLEAERERLALRYVELLECLATTAEQNGDFAAAAQWWRGLVARDPWNGHAVLRLMEALHATGERGAALVEAERHAERLRVELEADPDPMVVAAAERLRRIADSNASSISEKVPSAAGTSTELAPSVPADPGRDRKVRISESPAARRIVRSFVSTGLVVATMVGVVLALRDGAGTAEGETADSPIDSSRDFRLAVLPFSDLSAPDESSYFGLGLTEEILTSLGRIEALRVISWSTVRGYAIGDRRLQEIGEELGVGRLLLGSVQRHENRLRITVRLVDPATGVLLWTQRYDRDLADLFELQSQIAGEITAALRVELTEQDRLRLRLPPTTDLTAYDLYLRGRASYFRYSHQENETAIVLFRRALERDPRFASAHAGLAKAYMSREAFTGKQAWVDSAKVHAREAIRLDPELAEGHAALGVYHFYDGRLNDAIPAFEAALRLNPNDAETLERLGFLQYQSGLFVQALRTLKRAVVLEPSSPVVSVVLSLVLQNLGIFDEGRAWGRRAIELQPDFGYAHFGLALVHFKAGHPDRAAEELRIVDSLPGTADDQNLLRVMGELELHLGLFDEAQKHIERGVAISPASPRSPVTLLAYLETRSGRHERARELLQGRMGRLERWMVEQEDWVVPLELAQAHALRGDLDQAYRVMKEAYARGLRSSYLFDHLVLEPLRQDPRYRALHERAKADVARMRLQAEREGL